MAYYAKKKLLGSSTTFQMGMENLTVRTNGAANPTSIEGSLKSWIKNIVYSTNTWVVTFVDDFAVKVGSTFGLSVIQDAIGTFGVVNLGYNPTTKVLTVAFVNAAGAAAAPPAAGSVNAVNIACSLLY